MSGSKIGQGVTDETRIRDAIELYKKFYKSSTSVPFDRKVNVIDYHWWRLAHEELSDAQKEKALAAYALNWLASRNYSA